MTRAREPPPDPVVDCMKRGCKCGKTEGKPKPGHSHRLLHSISELVHHGRSSRCVLPPLFKLSARLCRLAERQKFLGPGFNPHLPGFRHQFLAKALGATMWFFIFYRARCVTWSEICLCLTIHPLCAGKTARNFWYDPSDFLSRWSAHLRSVGIKSPVGGPRTWPS
jgi:hypothetical protein